MPFYSPTDGLFPPEYPCRVFDANGLEWHHVESCDTDTGVLTQFVVDRNGDYVLAEDGNIKRETVKTAAPLMLVKKGLSPPL